MLPNIAKHPSLIYAENVRTICQPLKKLNINYFSHVQIDKSNQFSAIANNPDYGEHYLRNKCYNIDIHTADRNLLGKHVIWDAFELSGKAADENQIAIQCGVDHIFTIIDQDQNGTHYYHFGSNILGKAINQIYLSNIDLLKLFICHFKEKVMSDKLLRQAYDLKFIIGEDAENYSATTHLHQLDSQKIRTAFLKDLRLIHLHQEQHKALSHREIEILMWLHHGKTANEIAQILNIAEITVNKHIANIKEKAKCYTQFQLGEFFSKNIVNLRKD
jgi:DNA-binding CsgD family transcriptional regulator